MTIIFADPNTPSSKGTRFLIAFMPNTASNRLSEDPIPNAYIVVTTDEMDTVDFSVTTHFSGTTDYNVTCEQPTRINFVANDSLYTTSGSENNKSISVISKMEEKISVYVVSDEKFSTDGYVALPCDGMVAGVDHRRYEYIVLSSTRQGTQDNPADTLWSSEFVVITCEANTVVNVRPSEPISLPGVFNNNQFGPGFSSAASNWRVGNSRNIPAEYTLTVGLSEADYTGTVIRATKPIVVLSGHQCGQVPVGNGACDHMIVQIPPHTTWGNTFLLNPLSGRNTGDLYRFATRLDDTQITITCVDAGGSNPTVDYQGTLNSAQGENWGEFQTHDSSSVCVDVPKFCCLQSTNPVVLAQYSYSFSVDQSCKEKVSDDLGDPFFTLIPPIVQYLNNFKVVPIDAIASPFTIKLLSVSVHVDYFQPDLITIDDAPFQSDPSQWQAIYCAGEDICGYAYTVEIDNEAHTVRHESDNAGIFGHVYGFSPQNSFSITGGMELQLISGQSCTT